MHKNNFGLLSPEHIEIAELYWWVLYHHCAEMIMRIVVMQHCF